MLVSIAFEFTCRCAICVLRATLFVSTDLIALQHRPPVICNPAALQSAHWRGRAAGRQNRHSAACSTAGWTLARANLCSHGPAAVWGWPDLTRVTHEATKTGNGVQLQRGWPPAPGNWRPVARSVPRDVVARKQIQTGLACGTAAARPSAEQGMDSGPGWWVLQDDPREKQSPELGGNGQVGPCAT